MSNVVVTNDGDTPDPWTVWITLDDHDPLQDPFGFVIGSGPTRDAAVAAAVADLEHVVERLQSPWPSVPRVAPAGSTAEQPAGAVTTAHCTCSSCSMCGGRGSYVDPDVDLRGRVIHGIIDNLCDREICEECGGSGIADECDYCQDQRESRTETPRG